MAYVNEEQITINQDTEEEVDTESEEEVDTEEEVAARKALAGKALARKNAEARKLIQEKEFLKSKDFYEYIIVITKLTFNNYISFLKDKKIIKECDVEEFFKSECSEEFQNKKMRVQNMFKKELFISPNDDFYDFAQK